MPVAADAGGLALDLQVGVVQLLVRFGRLPLELLPVRVVVEHVLAGARIDPAVQRGEGGAVDPGECIARVYPGGDIA